MDAIAETTSRAIPWNKGRLIGQKLPLKLKEIWAVRIRLQLAERLRDLALFNLAIDSKLRGCDLVSLSTPNKTLSLLYRQQPDTLSLAERPQSAKSGPRT